MPMVALRVLYGIFSWVCPRIKKELDVTSLRWSRSGGNLRERLGKDMDADYLILLW